MNIVNDEIIQETKAKADASPRKRANYCLHRPTDHLQRMLQVGNRGTYWPPHQHIEKLEFFMMLSGKMAVVIFDDKGQLTEVTILGENAVMAEIAPGRYHSVVVLSDTVSFIEVIEGFYDPTSHKSFPSWAPAENTPEVPAYLEDLTKEILAFTK